MKKKLSIILSFILLLCACVTLCACNEKIDSFRIKAEVWYENYGTSYGSGIYEEGSEVTITATPKNGSTFLAWTKNSVVVSYDAIFKFESNNANSGTYIAIFTYPQMDRVSVLDATYINTTYFEEKERPQIETTINVGEDYEHLYLYETISADNVTTKNDIVFSLDANKKIYVEAILKYTYTTIIDGESTENSQTVKTYFEIQLELNNNILESTICHLNALDGMVGDATLKLSFELFNVEQEVEE